MESLNQIQMDLSWMVEELGVTVTTIDAAELEKFRQAVQPIYDALSPEDREMVAKIRTS